MSIGSLRKRNGSENPEAKGRQQTLNLRSDLSSHALAYLGSMKGAALRLNQSLLIHLMAINNTLQEREKQTVLTV
jgi:hypothetical protein